jgi:shikimate 5-dehydrogenase
MENEILLGVAGLPVLHSKSPLMFEAIFKTLKLKGSYIRLCAKMLKRLQGISGSSNLME